MSMSRAGALFLAGIFTTIKIVFFAVELAAHEQIVAVTLGGLITLAAQLCWTAYWALHIQETLRQHSANRAQDVLDAIAAAVDQAACQSATDARVDLMRRLGNQADVTHANTRPTLVT